jgi:hypothetical protein
MISIDHNCSYAGCDKSFGMTHGVMEEVNRSPVRGEYSCVGDLLTQTFLKGGYLGGRFGAKIVAICDDYNAAVARRGAMIDANDLAVNTSNARSFGDVGLVVDVSDELAQKRLNAVTERRFPLIREHDKSDGGFLYCEDHAIEVEYGCPVCSGDLMPHGSESFRALEIMAAVNPGILLSSFTRRSEFDHGDRVVREARAVLIA